MSTRIKKWLKCDRCGCCLGEFTAIQKQFGRKGIYVEDRTIGWQRNVSKKHGWRRHNSGLDYCGGCSPDVFGKPG